MHLCSWLAVQSTASLPKLLVLDRSSLTVTHVPQLQTPPLLTGTSRTDAAHSSGSCPAGDDSLRAATPSSRTGLPRSHARFKSTNAVR
jgi:hypothetical protein